MADETPEQPALPDPLTLDPAAVPSAVLRRLIAEIQEETSAGRESPPRPPQAYDRVHNRHNRGPIGPYNRSHNRHNRS